MKKLALSISLFLPLLVVCQILNVPQDYPSIQRGIDASKNGDTVLVAEGNYNEIIDFKGKAISVASYYLIDGDKSHIENTIIDAQYRKTADSNYVVYFVSGENESSVLSGFTIIYGSVKSTKSGLLEGGPAYIKNSTPFIVDNIVVGKTYKNTESAKNRSYITWVLLNESIVKGVLYKVKDTALAIIPHNVMKEQDLGTFPVSEYNYNEIDRIYIRRKNSILTGVLLGAVAGFGIGVMSGFIAGDDPPCPSGAWFCTPVTAEQKAIVIGIPAAIAGAGLGALIGGVKVKIPIGYNKKNFYNSRQKLKSYSVH